MDEKDFKLIDNRINNLERRMSEIEKIYESINKLTVSVEKVAIVTKYLREDHNRLANRVDTLERKPEKRWDTVITSIVTGIIGAAIGAIVALLKK